MCTTTHMNFDDDMMMKKWKKTILPAIKSNSKDSNVPKGSVYLTVTA